MTTTTWILGPFVVRQAMRPDNPAFPCYVVLRGTRIVGKSFSMPDLDCCRWLERQTKDELVYAESSAGLSETRKARMLRAVHKANAYSVTAKRQRTTARYIHLAILEEEPV